MNDHGAFHTAIERGHALNETLLGLVQEEVQLAARKEPYPEERDDCMTVTGTKIEETAREIARLMERMQPVLAGMYHDEEVELLLGRLRRSIEETLDKICDAARTVREERDRVLAEINQSDRRNTAIRVYMNSRTH